MIWNSCSGGKFCISLGTSRLVSKVLRSLKLIISESPESLVGITGSNLGVGCSILIVACSPVLKIPCNLSVNLFQILRLDLVLIPSFSHKSWSRIRGCIGLLFIDGILLDSSECALPIVISLSSGLVAVALSGLNTLVSINNLLAVSLVA